MRKQPLTMRFDPKKKGDQPNRAASRQEGSIQKLKARADKKREPKEE